MYNTITPYSPRLATEPSQPSFQRLVSSRVCARLWCVHRPPLAAFSMCLRHLSHPVVNLKILAAKHKPKNEHPNRSYGQKRKTHHNAFCRVYTYTCLYNSCCSPSLPADVADLGSRTRIDDGELWCLRSSQVPWWPLSSLGSWFGLKVHPKEPMEFHSFWWPWRNHRWSPSCCGIRVP